MEQSQPVEKKLARGLVLAIIAFGVLFLYLAFQASQFYELSDMRAMDEAQIARNIARGQGFTTQYIRPLSLARIPHLEGHPVLTQPPLYPLWMSVLFRAFGASSLIASWASGIPFLLTIPLVAWIGWHCFSRRVALLGVITVAANLGLMAAATDGLEISLIVFLFTALALVFIYYVEKPARRVPLGILAGILTALLALTNTLWAIAFIAALVFLIVNTEPSRRFKALLGYLIAFGACMAPWWARNYALTRDPFYDLSLLETIMNTRTHASYTLYRSFDSLPIGVLSFFIHHPREIYEKLHDTAQMVVPSIPSLAGPIATGLFLVAIIVPLTNQAISRVRLTLYLTFVLSGLALVMLKPDVRLLLPVVPLATVIGMALFYELLDLRLRPLSEQARTRWTNFSVTLLILFQALPLLLTMAPGRAPLGYQPMTYKRACNELNSWASDTARADKRAPREPVYSDMPWVVAWYADRTAIWLPFGDVDMRATEQAVGQLRWLVVTPQIMKYPPGERIEGYAQMWQESLTSEPKSGAWRLRRRMVNGGWILLERVPGQAILPNIGR
jgi:4-amino-4-deoxy-L-arabinose transferase-like glycosyltransferase